MSDGDRKDPNEDEDEKKRGEKAETDLSLEILAKYDPEKLAQVLLDKSGKGKKLEHATRLRFERLLQDKLKGSEGLGRVRLVTGPLADELTKAHRADALTLANTGVVVLRSTRFDPGSLEGERILAHELTHVAQAQQGMHARGEASFGGSESEKEAHGAESRVDDEHEAHGAGGDPGEKERHEKVLREKVCARVLDMLETSQWTSWQRDGYSRPKGPGWRPL